MKNTSAVTKTSDLVPVLSKEFLDIQANIERGFTLKCMPHDKYIQSIEMFLFDKFIY